jgi:hypothetical protein
MVHTSDVSRGFFVCESGQCCLFAGAASLDAGASGCEEGTSGAHDSENRRGVFRGGDATALGVQRESGGEKSKADE